MSKKELFIKEIEELGATLSKEAMEYFESLKAEKKTKEMTEKGAAVLKYLQVNYETMDNTFRSKDIADGLGINGRSVSGTIRSLVTNGYVEKVGEDPVKYAITDLGKEYVFEK